MGILVDEADELRAHLLATTDATVSQIAVGATRYAGSVCPSGAAPVVSDVGPDRC